MRYAILTGMVSKQFATHKPTVYIIEHDPQARAELCALLAKLDVSIKAFSQAEEFLRQAQSAVSCCLIVELSLPGMSGLELLDALHAQNIRIPTIVLASDSDVATAVRTMRAGAIDFIDKPFIDRILLRRVSQVLADV